MRQDVCPRACRSLLCAALLLSALRGPAAPAAQAAPAADPGDAPPGDDAAPAQTVLLLVPRGQEAWLGSGDAFRAQLSDLPVALRVDPVGTLPGPLPEQLALARAAAERAEAAAVLWLDRAGTAELLLLVADPRSPRVAVRRIAGAPEGAGGAATVEAAAVAARSQVRALLGGDADAAPARGTAPPAVSARRSGGLEVGYALDVWSGAALFHAAHLRGSFRPLPWLSVALGTRLGPGLVLPGEVADLAVDRFPWALEVGWVAELAHRRLRVELALGPALEVVRVRPDPLPRGWSARPDGVTVLFGATASAQLSVRLVGGLHATLGVGADALFPDTTWSFRRTGEREDVAHPWPVRPRAFVALTLDAP